MIKEVPNNARPLPAAVALIRASVPRRHRPQAPDNTESARKAPNDQRNTCTSDQARLMITYGECVLGVGTDRLAVVLRRELLDQLIDGRNSASTASASSSWPRHTCNQAWSNRR